MSWAGFAIGVICTRAGSQQIGPDRETQGNSAMHSMNIGYRRLSLLVHLNVDRLVTLGVIALGLLTGAFLASLLIQY